MFRIKSTTKQTIMNDKQCIWDCSALLISDLAKLLQYKLRIQKLQNLKIMTPWWGWLHSIETNANGEAYLRRTILLILVPKWRLFLSNETVFSLKSLHKVALHILRGCFAQSDDYSYQMKRFFLSNHCTRLHSTLSINFYSMA